MTGIKDFSADNTDFIERTVCRFFLCVFGVIHRLILPLTPLDVRFHGFCSAGFTIPLIATSDDIRFSTLFAKVAGTYGTGRAVTLKGSILISLGTQLTFRAALTLGKAHKLRAAVNTDTGAVNGLSPGICRAGRAEISALFIRLKNCAAVFTGFLSHR